MFIHLLYTLLYINIYVFFQEKFRLSKNQHTFLEKHDFSNKKIVLFATSGGSRFGRTIENIRPSVADSTVIVEGDILNSNPSVEELKAWAEKFLK